MENHTFSDPKPVADSDKTSTGPAWYVHVYRSSSSNGPSPPQVDQQQTSSLPIVASLLINNETLPPRKRKGKVVWKLPDDGARPKFGSIERERLWELFKQQKKERRKQQLQLQQQQPVTTKETSTSGGDSNDQDHEVDCEAGAAGCYDKTGTGCAVDVHQQSKSDDNGTLSQSTTNGGNHRSTVTISNGYATAAALATQKPAVVAKDDKASQPLGIGAAQSSSVTAPIPSSPPPGFAMTKLSLQDEEKKTNKTTTSVTAAAPVSSQLQLPPPGIVAPTLSTQQQSLPPPVPNHPAPSSTPQYLSLYALPQLPLLFAQLLSTGRAHDWLAHYAPHSQSSLQLASAQVTCASRADQLQQWLSLQQGVWEPCPVCTVQPLLRMAVMNGDNSNDTAAAPSMVLTVLSGRTRQKTELLVFALSLAWQLQEPPQLGYQIVQDVLTLTPV